MGYITQHPVVSGVIAIVIGLVLLIPAMLNGWSDDPNDDKPKSTSVKYVVGIILVIAGILILLVNAGR